MFLADTIVSSDVSFFFFPPTKIVKGTLKIKSKPRRKNHTNHIICLLFLASILSISKLRKAVQKVAAWLHPHSECGHFLTSGSNGTSSHTQIVASAGYSRLPLQFTGRRHFCSHTLKIYRCPKLHIHTYDLGGSLQSHLGPQLQFYKRRAAKLFKAPELQIA